ncbi:hypothetical protein [Helicobacter mehlei]|uniref:Uncharacterized protein n=1 Tax=Helicobacter mehlei TaxID=2316080 RepID=A0A553ULW4_9HELI|nr:hypothetical protein [Helicobacter mehlei]TSA81175.1 hypothetical protein FNE76_06735 [Helicobacter mehlei]
MQIGLSWKFYGILVSGLVFLGCAHTESRAQLAQFQQAYYAKQNPQADKLSKKFIDQDKKQKDAPLWELQNGVNAFMMGSYKPSLEMLDKADKVFDTNYKNLEKTLSKVGGATFGNETNKPYEGHMYEWALTNYYKALDYALLGNMQEARVEFNRTIERQRRLKEFYSKAIQKAHTQMEEEAKNKNPGKLAKFTARLGNFDQELEQRYSNLKYMAAYDGFINPWISYVAGLFYTIDGDSKGIDDLKEAYAVSKIPLVAQDIKNFEHHSTHKRTWVVLEDGVQPTLKEYKITELNFAIPTLKDGKDFHSTFRLVANGKAQDFEVLSHFDAVVQTEYKVTLPAIKTRAISSAILKTAAGKGLQTAGAATGGDAGMAMMAVGGIMSMVNKATTAADIRGSNIFPKTVYVARFDNDETHNFAVNVDHLKQNFQAIACNDTTKPTANQFCGNKNNIIFVRSLPNSLSVQVLPLK